MAESYTKSSDASYVVVQWGQTKSVDGNGAVSYPFPLTTKTIARRATNTVTGQRNPNWKAQIKLQTGATTSLSGERYRIEEIEPFEYYRLQQRNVPPQPPGGNAWTFEDHAYGLPAHTWESPFAVTADVQTSVDNRAIRKFLQQCESARSSVELGQDIGELKQTIEGILHPLKSMQDLVKSHSRNLKKGLRGKRLNRKNLHKAVADSYLEWTFGWNPLAHDIADGIAGLITRSDHPPSVPVRGSAMSPFRLSEGLSNPCTVLGMAPNCRYLSTGTYSSTLTGAIKTGSVGGPIGVAQILQLDAQHFVPTLWDLLPYSFVADYFTNIGDIISGVCFRFSDLAWGQKTVRTTNKRVYRMFVDTWGLVSGFHLVNEHYFGGNATFVTTAIARSRLTPSDLWPRFEFSIPISSKPWENLGFLSLARLSNAAIAEEFRKFW